MKKRLNRPSPGRPSCGRLEELVAAAKLGPAEALDFDPAAVREEFWKGTAAMAISWPTGARTLTPGPSPEEGEGERESACGFRRVARCNRSLPSDRANPGNRAATTGPVCSAARHRRAHGRGQRRKRARRRRVRVSPLADRSTVEQPGLCRQSRNDALPKRAGRFADGLGRDAMCRQRPLRNTPSKLRKRSPSGSSSRRSACPAGMTYLAALDEAVQAAVRGKQTPAEALKAAAEKWRGINKRLGRRKAKGRLHAQFGVAVGWTSERIAPAPMTEAERSNGGRHSANLVPPYVSIFVPCLGRTGRQK